MKTFSRVSPKLKVKGTKKYGKGVFAEEDIKKGQSVHIMNGETISNDEGLRRVLEGYENVDDVFQIGEKKYIDLDNLSRTFNHSCNPNVGIRKKNEMFALKNIKKGEEITYDYSATVAPTIWSMKCKCGSKNCRKIIGDITSIPDKDLKKYEASNSLQDYMKNVLKTIKRDKKGNVILPSHEVAALKILNKKMSDKKI